MTRNEIETKLLAWQDIAKKRMIRFKSVIIADWLTDDELKEYWRLDDMLREVKEDGL